MALLTDKVVLVSGGTQGVGAGVAAAPRARGRGRRRHRPPRRGRRGAAAELEAAGATALRAGRRGRCRPGPGRGARRSRRTGRVDCLVNAAGLTARGTLLDTTPELFDAHIAVNLRAPFFLMQAAVTDMLRPQGTRHDRQHHLLLRAGRPAVPGPLRRGQGRPGRPDPQRRPRPPLGPHPDQRPRHRLDRDRGRGRHPAPFHAADDTWREGPRAAPDGQARPGRRDRRLRGVPALGPQRRRHRVGHRLGPERLRRPGLKGGSSPCVLA